VFSPTIEAKGLYSNYSRLNRVGANKFIATMRLELIKRMLLVKTPTTAEKTPTTAEKTPTTAEKTPTTPEKMLMIK